MTIKQISIFVENKPGRLASITSALSENDIDIRALSIADTTDYGILRLIVDKPDKAIAALKAQSFTVSVTEVIGIIIPDTPGSFSSAVKALFEKNVNIEYAYAFITPEVGNAYVIIRVEDNAAAAEALAAAGVKLIDESCKLF